MIKKVIKVTEERDMYLYDQHDVDEEKEELIEKIDALIEFLSSKKDEIKSWTVEEMTSEGLKPGSSYREESKLGNFRDCLAERDMDDEEEFFGLVPDVMIAIDRLSHLAWNVRRQEEIGNEDEINKRYYSFTY